MLNLRESSMIYSCAKNKISMICQQLGRGFND